MTEYALLEKPPTETEIQMPSFLAKALIKEVGRSEAVGKPILYGVTDEFMDAFKLMSLDELPELPSLNNNEELNLVSEVIE